MTYDSYWLQDHPFWTFEDSVAIAVDEFPSSWRDYWGIGTEHTPDHLDPDEWQLANQMHDTARRICDMAAKLHGGLPKDIRTLPAVLEAESQAEKQSGRELAQLIRSSFSDKELESEGFLDFVRMIEWEADPAEGKEKLFRTAVQIYAWKEFGCSPGSVGSRLVDLLEFVVHVPGERSREYLARVAACYIRGMPTEMAVMARAVLEAALEIPELEEEMEAVILRKSKRHPTLIDWIEAAEFSQALNREGRSAAETVKNAGDDAVHNHPQLVPQPRMVLENLCLALNQIERFRKRDS